MDPSEHLQPVQRHVKNLPPEYVERMSGRPPNPPAPLTWESVRNALQQIGHWLAVGLKWVEEHDADVRDFLEKSRQHARGPWAYLIELVDAGTGVTIMVGLEAQQRLADRPESSARSRMPSPNSSNAAFTKHGLWRRFERR